MALKKTGPGVNRGAAKPAPKRAAAKYPNRPLDKVGRALLTPLDLAMQALGQGSALAYGGVGDDKWNRYVTRVPSRVVTSADTAARASAAKKLAAKKLAAKKPPAKPPAKPSGGGGGSGGKVTLATKKPSAAKKPAAKAPAKKPVAKPAAAVSGPQYGIAEMDPEAEARKSAQLQDEQRKAALGYLTQAINANRARALQEGYGAVNSAMNDRGLLYSTAAGKNMAKAYEDISSPYDQQLATAQGEYSTFANQLGDNTALQFQNLMRGARDESRTNTGLAANIYEMLSSDALAKRQLGLPEGQVRFPSQPAAFSQVFNNTRYLTPQPAKGPYGDPQEQSGRGPFYGGDKQRYPQPAPRNVTTMPVPVPRNVTTMPVGGGTVGIEPWLMNPPTAPTPKVPRYAPNDGRVGIEPWLTGPRNAPKQPDRFQRRYDKRLSRYNSMDSSKPRYNVLGQRLAQMRAMLPPQPAVGPYGDPPETDAWPGYTISGATLGEKTLAANNAQQAADNAWRRMVFDYQKKQDALKAEEESGNPWQEAADLWAMNLGSDAPMNPYKFVNFVRTRFGMDPLSLAEAGDPQAQAFVKLIGYKSGPSALTAVAEAKPQGGGGLGDIFSPKTNPNYVSAVPETGTKWVPGAGGKWTQTPTGESDPSGSFLNKLLTFFNRGF